MRDLVPEINAMGSVKGPRPVQALDVNEMIIKDMPEKVNAIRCTEASCACPGPSRD